jgi:hypothetical protein
MEVFLDFYGYELAAKKIAVYPNNPSLVTDTGSTMCLYPFFGLAAETGKLMEIIKDATLDAEVPGTANYEACQAMRAELGKILWCLTMCAYELETSIGLITKQEIADIKRQQAVNTPQGSGDTR